MVENKKLKNKLLLITIILIISEIILYLLKDKYFLIDILSNIMLGVIGSSIVSYIMTLISYNYKKEETKEILVKKLLNIYSKMVIFKTTYNNSNNKNESIVELQREINDYIGDIHDIEYDLVYKLEEITINDTIILKKYNINSSNSISNNYEVINNKIIINSKGINNQKEFIASFNKLLEKVRNYMDSFCVPKYIIEYNLFKQIDERYDDIDSKSHKKIKYTHSSK